MVTLIEEQLHLLAQKAPDGPYFLRAIGQGDWEYVWCSNDDGKLGFHYDDVDYSYGDAYLAACNPEVIQALARVVETARAVRMVPTWSSHGIHLGWAMDGEDALHDALAALDALGATNAQ